MRRLALLLAPALVASTFTPAQAQSHPLADWLTDRAVALTTTDPAAPLDDLAHLRRSVRGATVVGLGEAAHNLAEITRLKHRTVRYLVEERGFRTLAWEEDWTLGTQIDTYVRTGKGDLRALIGQMSTGWRSQEVAEVLSWLRRYNATHRDQVHFVGVEGYATRPLAAEAIESHIARYAPTHLAEAKTHIAVVKPFTDNMKEYLDWYRQVENKQHYIHHATALRTLVESLPHNNPTTPHRHPTNPLPHDHPTTHHPHPTEPLPHNQHPRATEPLPDNHPTNHHSHPIEPVPHDQHPHPTNQLPHDHPTNRHPHPIEPLPHNQHPHPTHPHPDNHPTNQHPRATEPLPDNDLITQHARAIESFYVRFTLPLADNMAHRDTFAAETLRWWQRRTGDRVVYWAASAHTANIPALRVTHPPHLDITFPSAGSHLKRWYGPRYRSIGFTFDRGTGTGDNGNPVVLPPPAPHWFEAP